MGLQVPVEEPERRVQPRRAGGVQVRGIPHDVGGVFVEMTAEDHRSGAHPYINTVLQRVQETAGQLVAGDAAREVVMAAAPDVDDVGVQQAAEHHLPGQAVQLQDVELAPAETIQPAQVGDEPPVVATLGVGRGWYVHDAGRGNRLAQQVAQGLSQCLIAQASRGQQKLRRQVKHGGRQQVLRARVPLAIYRAAHKYAGRQRPHFGNTQMSMPKPVGPNMATATSSARRGPGQHRSGRPGCSSCTCSHR